MNSKTHDFVSNTGFNLVAQLTSLVIGLATSAILARSLGSELRGSLGVILLLPMTLMAIFSSGFTSTVTYSVASEDWKDTDAIPNILGIASYLTLIMIGVATITLQFHELLFPDVSIWLLISAIVYLPISVLVGALQCLLTGKHAFREKMKLSFIVSPVRLLVFGVLLLAFPKRLDIGLLAYLLAEFLGLVVLYVRCVAICKSKRFWHMPKFDLRHMQESLAYGGYSQLANLAGFLNYKVDQFIVFWMLGEVQLGIYIIAVVLAEKLWLFVGNVSSVLFSLTAKNGATKNSHTTAARVAAIVFWCNLACAVVLAIVAKPFVEWVYTTEYSESALVIIYLLPGIVSLGFGKVTANYIAGIGRPGINAVAACCGVVINVLMNLWLIPVYGLLGAAISTSLSYSAIALISFSCFLWLTRLKWYEPLVPRYRDVKMIFRYCSRKFRSLLGRLVPS